MARVFLIHFDLPNVKLTSAEEANIMKDKVKQLADMLEAQILILVSSGHHREADVARQEVASLRLLAEVSD